MRKTASPTHEMKSVTRNQPNFAPPWERPDASTQIVGVKKITRYSRTISGPINGSSIEECMTAPLGQTPVSLISFDSKRVFNVSSIFSRSATIRSSRQYHRTNERHIRNKNTPMTKDTLKGTIQ